MPVNDDEVRAAALAALPRWSWGNFPHDPPQIAQLMRLEPNGWQALIAYLAGPSWVYQEPARFDPTVEADLTEIHTEMVAYLAEAGVPEPPMATQWMLCLPEGVSEREVQGICNVAVRDSAPDDLRRNALEVHAALRILLNGRMPPLSW